jgi:hypothetical protein
MEPIESKVGLTGRNREIARDTEEMRENLI